MLGNFGARAPGRAGSCVSAAAPESSCPLAVNGTDPTMDGIQVKKDTKPVFHRIPDLNG